MGTVNQSVYSVATHTSRWVVTRHWISSLGGAGRDGRWWGDERSGASWSGRAGRLVDEAVDRPVIAVDNPVR